MRVKVSRLSIYLSILGNTLYNVMPDIVSRLSDPEVGIAEENFRTIMRYIIGLIEKDKLLESLVEKLCHRSVQKLLAKKIVTNLPKNQSKCKFRKGDIFSLVRNYAERVVFLQP